MAAEGQYDTIASDRVVQMKQRCVTEFLYMAKIAPIDTHWCLLYIYRDKQRLLAHWHSGWCVSAVVTTTWKTSHTPDGQAQLSHHEMKSILISSSTWISGLWPGNCVQNWILASIHWKRWLQHWNIAMFVPPGSHKCSQRNRKDTVCKFFKTYGTNTRLKVTVSWSRCGVTTTNQSINSIPWSGDMWICH